MRKVYKGVSGEVGYYGSNGGDFEFTLKNAHLLRCRCGFFAQHTKKYASLEALLCLASVRFLSVNWIKQKGYIHDE